MRSLRAALRCVGQRFSADFELQPRWNTCEERGEFEFISFLSSGVALLHCGMLQEGLLSKAICLNAACTRLQSALRLLSEVSARDV